jgi:hypothetical protein
MEKRENFAISLRKKKTTDIVQAKRRKIIDAMSKGKKKVIGIQPVAPLADSLIPIEEME